MKLFIWTLAAIAAFGIIVFLLARGFYPVAWSWNWSVNAREFRGVLKSSMNYYGKIASLASTSTPQTEKLMEEREKAEMRRAILDKLIENKIIDRILKQNLGKDLGKIVNQKLINLAEEKTGTAKNLDEAVKFLYNLPYEKFKEAVLIPEIKQEILQGQLFFRGLDFTKWLAQAKNAIQPIILLPDLYWKDGKVELKN